MPSSVVIPNNYGLATFKWTFIPAGKQFTVTMGYYDNTLVNTPNVAAAQYYSALTATGCPCQAISMNANYRFEGVTVLQRLSSGLLQVGTHLVPITGSVAADPNLNPVFTTLVVSKQTLFAGRAYRGRMYVPLLSGPESNTDFNGGISTGIVAQLQLQWDNFRGALLTPGGYPMMLLHSPSSITIVPTAIQTLVVRPVVGVQRRRRARGA